MTASRKNAGNAPPLISFTDLPRAFILAAKGKVADLERFLTEVKAVEESTGTMIHAVDAAAVCGAAHLASAVLHARRARERGRARARDAKVEAMLYLSGRRQIASAIEVVGLGAKTKAVGLAIEGDAASATRAAGQLERRLGLERDDRALSASKSKLKRLGIRPTNLSDPEALALEATAMLDLE